MKKRRRKPGPSLRRTLRYKLRCIDHQWSLFQKCVKEIRRETTKTPFTLIVALPKYQRYAVEGEFNNMLYAKYANLQHILWVDTDDGFFVMRGDPSPNLHYITSYIDNNPDWPVGSWEFVKDEEVK